MTQLVRVIKEHICKHHEERGFTYETRPFCLPLHPDVINHKNKRLAHCRRISLFSAFDIEYECDAVEQEQVIGDLVAEWYAEQEQVIGAIEVEIEGKRYHKADLKKAGAMWSPEIEDDGMVWGWFPECPKVEAVFASHVYITIHDPENYGA